AAGTIELGIAGGYSVSLNNEQVVLENGQIVDLKTVYGIHGLLRVGWLVTDEHGPSLLRGNLELTLEPTYIHLDSATSANLYAGALLARWLFAGNGNIRPYLQGGAGAIDGRIGLRTGDCELNFLLEGGPGLVLFISKHTAIDVGFRFHHMSNGSRCSPNFGVNSVMG